MRSKVIELTVEIHIHQVSCPGVWLCPEGDVSLAVFALGSSHHTRRLPPSFPLQYKENFCFKERLPNACSLSNLQRVLSDETIYCELVQWQCGSKPCILAQYLGCLADVLFPPDICSSDGVDLLMKTTKIFPFSILKTSSRTVGILAPKIELSTKVRIDELYEEATSRSPSPVPSPQRNQQKQTNLRRQSPVCHSIAYHRYRCRSLSPRERKKCRTTTNRDDTHEVCACLDNTEAPDTDTEYIEDSHPKSGRVAQLLESARVDHRTRSVDRSSRSPDRSDQRNRSPDRRTRSPDRGTRSPDRRTISPDRRTRSPDRRTRSPDRRTRSPDRWTRSPDRSRGRSPRRSYVDCPCLCSICIRYHQAFHVRHMKY